MRIFIIFAILSVVLAIALRVAVFIISINLRAESGIPFILSVLAAPFVCVTGIILGTILQGIYNFVIARNLFKRLEKYSIFRDERGNFLIFFSHKRDSHRLEVQFLGDKTFTITHSVMQNQQWQKNPTRSRYSICFNT